MGHNWLAVLTGTLGTPVDGDANSWKNGPGGCARCHFTGAWKQTLTELNAEGASGPSGDGSGIATLGSIGIGTALKSTWSGSDAQKKANNIECMVCHAGNYQPGVAGNYTNPATGGVEYPAGMRKPTFADGTDPNEANFVINQPYYMSSDKWNYSGGTWTKQTFKIWMKPDLSQTALDSISKTPTNEACNRCHNYSGGGARNKRGMWFRPNADAHADLSCLDCHKTEKALGKGSSSHKLAIGMNSDIWARDIKDWGADATNRNVQPSECSNSSCHGTRPHNDKTLNDHFSGVSDRIGDGIPSGKIDCRTCHIPYQYGQMLKDFTRTTFNASTGLYDTYVENRTNASNQVTTTERPVYMWYNGISDAHKHGPAAVTRTDSNTKITTFTRYEFKSIVDAAYNKIPLKLGVLFMTGSVYNAASTGKVPASTAVEAKMSYTPYGTAIGANPNNTLNYVDAKSNFIIGHRVAPKAQALTCADCHNAEGKIGGSVAGSTSLTNLGYTTQEVEVLKQMNR